MYNEKLEALITAALADGVLTDKEKNLLFKKAEAMGIDRDEFELVLDGRLAKRKKEMEAQAPQAAKPAKKEGAIPQELDDLIKEYLTDGIISAKERQVLLNKAQALGLNVDEVDLYIDAQQQKADQAVAATMNKRRGKTCPYCGSSVPELTDKCPNCGGNITPEASKELEDIFDHLESALVNFKSGEDVEKNKAEVERYVRKARMYYGNNPKVQHLLEEVEMESEAAEEEAKKNARKKFLLANKKVIAIIVVALIGVIYSIWYINRPTPIDEDPAATSQVIENSIKNGNLIDAQAAFSAYCNKNGTGAIKYDLSNAAGTLRDAYIESGNYDKACDLYNFYSRHLKYDEDAAQVYYDLLCKCIDHMKAEGNKSQIESFISRKVGAFEEDSYHEEWSRNRVQKRLYKYAGI